MHVDRRDGIVPSQDSHDVPHAQLFKPDVRLNRATGVMTGQHDPSGILAFQPSHLYQSRVDSGFVCVDVEGGRAQDPGLERIGEGLFIDQRPTGNIDKSGAWAKAAQRLGRDKRLAVGRSRSAEDSAVGHAKEAVEGRVECSRQLVLNLRRLADNVVIGDLHAKSGMAHLCSNLLPNVPEPDQTQDVPPRVVACRCCLSMTELECLSRGRFTIGIARRGGREIGQRCGAHAPGKMSESGDDEGNSKVGYRLGGGEPRVAVDDA